MLLHQHSVTRLISLANAARLLSTASARNIASPSHVRANSSIAFQAPGTRFFLANARFNLNSTVDSFAANRNNLKNAFTQPSQDFFSTSSTKLSSTTAAALSGSRVFPRHSVRGFSLWTHCHPATTTTARSTTFKSFRTIQQQQWRSYVSKQFPPVPRRRPFRFLLKMMAISSVLVALPAIMIFGAPAASIIFIPLAIGGLFGGALLLTGGVLLFVFPIVAIGGALTFWLCAMPVAGAAKDLNKILKRASSSLSSSSSSSTWTSAPALAALGPDWEIQTAKPDEWFKWTFPKSDQELDKVSIRMAIFDPNDHSDRKRNTFRFLDNIKREEIVEQDHDDDAVRTADFKEGELVERKGDSSKSNIRTRRISSSSSSSDGQGHFQISNNSDGFSVQNFSVDRENDHVLIRIEDNGAKLLNQKWGKKYLELAQIVAKAAAELEAAHPELKLGQQIVLVQNKDKARSFWNKFSLCGDIALRIPFDRTWIQDVSDEDE